MRLNLLIILPALALAASGLTGQTLPVIPSPDTIPATATGSMRPHALGLDLLVSNGGFGLGTFYRREFSDDFSVFLDLSVSEVKDDDEVQVYNYYGESYTLGKVNRFLILPLCLGVQKRFFQEDILDNFRPYLSAAVGPTMIYVFPEREEYFTAISHGQPEYTIGGYIGGGAYFGSDKSNLFGLNLRYYFIPYPSGLEGIRGRAKTQFGGFYITMNFGTAW